MLLIAGMENGDLGGEQGAAVLQQPLHLIEAAELLGRDLGFTGLDLQRQFHGREALLQPHQPMRKRMDGLRQILRAAGDAE